jgi:myo-inositol catabolism protein IolH
MQDVKIALDPLMLRQLPLAEVCGIAAEIGYRYLELSPREDFLVAREEPRVTPERVAELAAALRASGLELASLWTVYRWADPQDAEVVRDAVRYWKRAIEIAVALGCANLNSELSGLPDDAERSRAAFLRAMEQLLPILEREGLTMSIEAHPGDFEETNSGAVALIRSLNSPHVRYLYCAPHTFHLGSDVAAMLREAAPVLAHVHVADTLDHTRPLRFIFNPPVEGLRVHQHLNIGEGEVNWDAFFATLHEIGFDGIITSSVFAWQERAVESSRFMFERINAYVDRYWGHAHGSGSVISRGGQEE